MILHRTEILCLVILAMFTTPFMVTNPTTEGSQTTDSEILSLQRCQAHPLKKGNLDHDASFSPVLRERRSGDTRGEYSLLCILVQFQVDDDPQTTGNGTMDPRHDGYYFDAIFDRMQDYYLEVSYGQFVLDATVTDQVYTLDNQMSHYGANNNEVQRNVWLARDAVEKADPDVDFGQYGKFIVIHAGSGEETDVADNSENDIWSNHLGLYHMQAVLGGPITTDDGANIREISIVPETHDQDSYTGSNITGVICHEFGHDLGLPDLYDVHYTSDGIGIWGLMSGGPSLNRGYTPCHPTAWSKVFLDWVDPIEITENTGNIRIRNVEEHTDIYKVTIPHTGGSQYFLIENKAKAGFDYYLPHGGLLIWHIDEDKLYEGIGGGFTRMDQNTVNTEPAHKGVDLEEASGTQELDVLSDHNGGDGDDPWYSNSDGFNPSSTPNSTSYEGEGSEIHLFDISTVSDTMTFSVRVVERKVRFYIVDDNETTALPGETVSFELEMSSNREGSGPVTDWITLNTYGYNWKWLSLSEVELRIRGKNVPYHFYANVTVPPGALYGDSAFITISGGSNDSTPAQNLLTLTVVTERTKGFTIERVEDVSILPGADRGVNVTVWLNNSGNAPEEFDILLKDLSDRDWKGLLASGKDSMLAGKSKVLEVTIGPNSRLPVYVHINSTDGSLAGELCKATLRMEQGMEKSVVSFNATVLQVYGISVSAPELEGFAKPRHTTTFVITVNNLGNGEDNVTISLSSKKAGWETELSEKYLVIPAGESSTAEVSIIPHKLAQPGETHTFTVGADSRGGQEVKTPELTVTVEEYDGMAVEVSRYNATVDHGSYASFDIELRNEGSSDDVYAATVVEKPGDFTISMTGQQMEAIALEAYDTRFLKLRVSVGALRPAGTYSVVLDVGSTTNSKLVSRITFNVTVRRDYSFEAKLDGELKSVYQKGRVTFYLTVNNTSNTNVTLNVDGTDSADGIQVEIIPSREMSMAIGGSEVFEIRVEAHEGARPGKRTITLRITMFESSLELEEEVKVMVTAADTPGDGEEDGGLKLSGTILAAGGAVMVIIIGIVLSLLIVLSRKRRRKGDLDEGQLGQAETEESGFAPRAGEGQSGAVKVVEAEVFQADVVEVDVTEAEVSGSVGEGQGPGVDGN